MRDSIEIHGNYMQYRILGNSSSREKIGAGFMEKKPGVDVSNVNPIDISIVYVLCGSGTYTDHRNRIHSLRPGSIFLRIPGISHSNTIDAGTPWRELFLALGPQQGKALTEMGFVDPEQPVGFIGDQPVITEQVYDICRRLQNADPEAVPYLFKNMLSTFLDIMELNHSRKKTPEGVLLIEKISEYIAAHPNGRITTEQIAGKFGVSVAKLRKDFKSIKGISIGNFLIRNRIETSFKLLGDVNLTIGEIAEKLGYKSIYDFSNQFKKVTGHPPTYYRK